MRLAYDNEAEPDYDGLFLRMIEDNEIDSVGRSLVNGGVCPMCGGHLVRFVVHTTAGHVAFDACQYAVVGKGRCSYGRIGK